MRITLDFFAVTDNRMVGHFAADFTTLRDAETAAAIVARVWCVGIDHDVQVRSEVKESL